ncbi:MAG TPA: SGNH/GDSL hydrolase family protein [Roseiarcus sp.]|nr:SGNH/GDSL hydrolase family protein [Roseiarcus sp.]
MAVIVAFGDSNTWGYDPATGARFAPQTRWTGVMAAALGPDHRVIEEGLNGRTTVFLDPIEPDRRGADYLPPCLRSHAPLDLVVIALGCNDMKARFNVSAAEIAYGVERLVMLALAEPVGPNGRPPGVLLVAPPPVARLTGFAEMFRGAESKSRDLAQRYAEVAQRRGVGFVDAGQFIRCSDLDGIHYEADQHAVLGRALAEATHIVLP